MTNNEIWRTENFCLFEQCRDFTTIFRFVGATNFLSRRSQRREYPDFLKRPPGSGKYSRDGSIRETIESSDISYRS